MSRRKDGRPRSVTAAPDQPSADEITEESPQERLSIIDPKRRLPAGLRTDEFFLRPITAADAARDHEAVMETRVDLRVWEQSSWPEDDFTVEANGRDLADLEKRHRERRAYGAGSGRHPMPRLRVHLPHHRYVP